MSLAFRALNGLRKKIDTIDKYDSISHRRNTFGEKIYKICLEASDNSCVYILLAKHKM